MVHKMVFRAENLFKIVKTVYADCFYFNPGDMSV